MLSWEWHVLNLCLAIGQVYGVGIGLVERVYLDTNVYCRPLDDQGERRIRLESDAFLEIADLALRGDVVVVSSDYVKFEIERIFDPLKRKDVRGFERALSLVNIASEEQVVALARVFSVECGVNSLDALHVSAACFGGADFLLTCDDEVLRREDCLERLAVEKGYRLKVRSPVSYVKER